MYLRRRRRNGGGGDGASAPPRLLALLFVVLFGELRPGGNLIRGGDAAVFTLQNKCRNTVWPAVQPNAGKPMIGGGGLRLGPNGTATVAAPPDWAGRFWARRGCRFDAAGAGNCTTGDCGGVLRCAGPGGRPPLSVAEFNLDDPVDFYDVSLVDGYNVKVGIVPRGGGGPAGGCRAVRCARELLRMCPGELRVVEDGRVAACRSACEAFGRPEHCCTAAYADPKVCRPSAYSRLFKRACPRAYSYAYDDPTSLFTCRSADYLITFCG